MLGIVLISINIRGYVFTGVDLLVWAHEHNYERLFPIYNQKVIEIYHHTVH